MEKHPQNYSFHFFDNFSFRIRTRRAPSQHFKIVESYTKTKEDLFFLKDVHAELQDPDPKLFGNAGCGSVYNEC
jgi:hypothetical protein